MPAVLQLKFDGFWAVVTVSEDMSQVVVNSVNTLSQKAGNLCTMLETRVTNVLCWKSVHQQTVLPPANVAVGVVHEPAGNYT